MDCASEFGRWTVTSNHSHARQQCIIVQRCQKTCGKGSVSVSARCLDSPLSVTGIPSSLLVTDRGSTRLREVYSLFPENPWIPTSRPDSWYKKSHAHPPPSSRHKNHVSLIRQIHVQKGINAPPPPPQAKGSVGTKIGKPLKRHSLEKHANKIPPPPKRQPAQPPKSRVLPAQDRPAYFLCPSTKLSASSVGTQSTVLVLL